MKFVLQSQRLPMGSVATKVKEVMGEAQRSLASMVGRHMAGFSLPISGSADRSRFWRQGEYSQKARDRAGGPASLVEEPRLKHHEV